jgi:hypothetical protein
MGLLIGQLGTSEPSADLLLAGGIETIIGALSRSHRFSQSTGSRGGPPGGWHGFSPVRRSHSKAAWAGQSG